MSEAWYAAFGLLTLLALTNAVVLVAVMRQIGVLHQRVPPRGPGSVGPDPGTIFPRLDLSPVPGSETDGWGRTPVAILAFVRPGCDLCDRIPGFLQTYRQSASPEVGAIVSFAMTTDAPADEAEQFRAKYGVHIPLLRHPRVQDHYQLVEVGAPYLLALARGDDDSSGEQLLEGGIVNTLEQLEDLVEIAIIRHATLSDEDEEARAWMAPPAAATAQHDGGGRDLHVHQRLTAR